MNINPVIYENLTPKQRIIASIEAMSRNDEEEGKRLMETCPKKNYKMSDHDYSGKLRMLQDLALAVECDMRGCALNFFTGLWLGDNLKKEKKDEQLDHYVESSPECIQQMISIKQAWHEFIEDEGIEISTIDKAYERTQHFAIGWTTCLADNTDLEACPEAVERYRDILDRCMERVV